MWQNGCGLGHEGEGLKGTAGHQAGGPGRRARQRVRQQGGSRRRSREEGQRLVGLPHVQEHLGGVQVQVREALHRLLQTLVDTTNSQGTQTARGSTVGQTLL